MGTSILRQTSIIIRAQEIIRSLQAQSEMVSEEPSGTHIETHDRGEGIRLHLIPQLKMRLLGIYSGLHETLRTDIQTAANTRIGVEIFHELEVEGAS